MLSALLHVFQYLWVSFLGGVGGGCSDQSLLYQHWEWSSTKPCCTTLFVREPWAYKPNTSPRGDLLFVFFEFGGHFRFSYSQKWSVSEGKLFLVAICSLAPKSHYILHTGPLGEKKGPHRQASNLGLEWLMDRWNRIATICSTWPENTQQEFVLC